jgi:UDP-glucose 4-epimerase
VQILITGGCGFIGTNLVARLSARPDVRVRIFDNHVVGQRADLDAGFTGDCITGDIRDRHAVAAALDGCDAVVHLAADTRVIESIVDPQLNFDTNVIGSFHLLEAMRSRGVRRLINASTGGAIIGDAVPPVHERMLPQPMSPYGASKLMVEAYCSAYAASYGLRPLSLRFANVYGPRSFHKGSVVAAFLKRIRAGQPLVIYGDGQQTRDYVAVEDICDGIIAALDRDVCGVVQLGSGVPLALNDLVAALRGVVAPLAIAVDYQPFRSGEVVHTYCDIAKARAVLGYAPRVALPDGLSATWAWFATHASAPL